MFRFLYYALLSCNTHCVYRVNPFPTFILLSFNPVPVEIGEQPVDVVRTSSISVPFSSIISEQILIHEVFGAL